jgi:hypothetical protein
MPTGRRNERRGRGIVAFAAAVVVALAAPTYAGHESPFYPSYYPQEIRLEAMTPAAAGRLLANTSIHAYVGGDPYAGRTAPASVVPVESLGSYVVVTLNPASRRLATPAARCAVAADVIRRLDRQHGGFVFHPYPVTPYHWDYLEHADLAAAALRSFSPGAHGGTPPGWNAIVVATGQAAHFVGAETPHVSGGSGDWDARVETVGADELLASHAIRFAGWVGPPWLKDGWFDAYLLLAGSVADHERRAEIGSLYHRLVTGEYRGVEDEVNLERTLVSRLGQGCERTVAGYTLRREYYNTDYTNGVENVGFDSHSGFNSAIFIRTIKLKDFPWNGWLHLGVAGTPASPWNPISGFGDVFGRLMWAAVGDPALLPAPSNGGWSANRLGSWETWTERVQQTFGWVIGQQSTPRQQLDVPPDALLPHLGTGILERIKPGTRAADRVEYRVLASSFHDGTAMTVADVLYPFILAYRWSGGNPRDPHAYDPSVDRATALMRRVLVGIKVVGTQKVVKNLGGDLILRYDVPVVRMYVDYAGADPQQTADLALPWSTVPWHVLVLLEEAAKRGIGALSPEAAASQRLGVLDLVRSARQTERLAGLVDEFAARSYVPDALKGWASADEARRRWRALMAFYRANGHFLVTNGPYRLAKWSSTGAVLAAFRDLSYPLGVGSFDKDVLPHRASIPTLSQRGERIEFRPEVERVLKYDRYYKIVREALGSETSGAFDAVTPLCRYVIVGSDGHVVKVGTAPDPKNGAYQIDLGDRLGRGAYTAFVTVFLNDNYMTPDVTVVSFQK